MKAAGISLSYDLRNPSKQDLKAVEVMLKELPKPEYENLCDFIGFAPPEIRILDLRYRYASDVKPTREYVAEELGMSPSTLDRRIKGLLKRIARCANKLIRGIACDNIKGYAPKIS
jgi:hypothetical protein